MNPLSQAYAFHLENAVVWAVEEQRLAGSFDPDQLSAVVAAATRYLIPIYIHTYLSLSLYIYLHMYVWIYICMIHTSIYIYEYIYIHT